MYHSWPEYSDREAIAPPCVDRTTKRELVTTKSLLAVCSTGADLPYVGRQMSANSAAERPARCARVLPSPAPHSRSATSSTAARRRSRPPPHRVVVAATAGPSPDRRHLQCRPASNVTLPSQNSRRCQPTTKTSTIMHSVELKTQKKALHKTCLLLNASNKQWMGLFEDTQLYRKNTIN